LKSRLNGSLVEPPVQASLDELGDLRNILQAGSAAQ
jgi:hypothetical protein